MPSQFNRRDFLKIGCGAAVTAALACGGVGYFATQPPTIAELDTSLKGIQPMNKILVTYATRAGSTVDVAKTIGETLNATGASVDVRPVKNVTTLQGYDAVVLGSAIRMGHWLPEAVDFVTSNQAQLSQRPTVLFTVHLLNIDDDDKSRAAREAYTAPVRQLVAPRGEVFFAGKMDFSKLSFLDGTIAKMVGGSERDLRNWDAIRGWAQGLPALLSHA